MNLLSLAVQGFAISVILPVIIQLIKPLWLRGVFGMWAVWAGCCAVAAAYLVLTKQVPEIIWSDPAQATSTVLAFGSAISALAQQWYRTLESQFKKIPSIVTGKSESQE